LWLPPSPDSAGIIYIGASGTLLVSDSEVNEIQALFTGDNLFRIDLNGNLLDTLTTIDFSDEPTGAAYNPANQHLFFSDDTGTRSVYEQDPGPDGLYGTPDDIVTSITTSAFGSNDPEGVTYNTVLGVLHIVDGVNEEVYTVNPGVNGIFDGVPPAGDDQVTSFDTTVLGTTDPEGIAYDSDFGHLYIAATKTSVVHVTTAGILVRTIDVSAANAKALSGLAYAPSSVNPSEMSLYIVDRGQDNNSNPNENDGKVYELSLPFLYGNTMPVVNIMAPVNGSTFAQGDSITFTGTATDIEDGELTWSMAWTSSLDGPIASGGSFLTSTLSLGTHTITASVTDSGDLQGSYSIVVMINYPIPVTTSLSPSAADAGGAGFTLTVDGSNFVTGSVVQWNGADRTTTFVSDTQLTADIPAADITVAGTASVTVVNPAPGGGTSNAQNFTMAYVNPETTITDPAGGTLSGESYLIQGSAIQGTDTIDNVQVSTDNGSSWNTATGTTGWSRVRILYRTRYWQRQWTWAVMRTAVLPVLS
jgi:hypothetical protein